MITPTLKLIENRVTGQDPYMVVNEFIKLNLLQLCKDLASRQESEYMKVSPVFYELAKMIGEITLRSAVSISVAESMISTAAIKTIISQSSSNMAVKDSHNED